MRRTWLLVWILLAGSAGAEPLLTDAPGDAEGPVSDGAMDLRGLEVEESADAFVFRLEVGALDGTADWRVDAGRWFVDLRHGDEAKRIEVGRSLDGFWWASLYERSPDAATGYAWIATLPFTYDEAAAIIEVTVERALLADERGAPPLAGRQLDGIVVSSRSHVGEMTDRMPDNGDATLAVAWGPQQTGPVRLHSEDPWRASNGEATTYVFTVTAQNTGAATSVTFGVEGVPDAWSALLPVPTIEMEAGASMDVPVVVQTPFAHSHGDRKSFIVTAVGRDTAGEAGRVELGVEFLAMPQPSGHHDTLYFHSRSQGNPIQPINELIAPGGYNSQVVMNADPDDEADTGEPKEARPMQQPGANQRAFWYIPLSPALRMGLDFDMARTGTLEVPMRTPVPLADARLSGWLYRCVPIPSGYDCDVLAQMSADPMAIEETATWVADVVPQDEADFVPYAPQSFLILNLYVDATRPTTTTGVDQMELLPGGWMQLPLDEYADPVDDLFASDALALMATDVEILADRGAPTLFSAILDNRLTEAGKIDLTLSGTNADWARIVGPSKVSLGPLQRHEIQVEVTPPRDASQGERADLILHARSAAGSSLLRLVATVSDAEPVDPVDARAEAPGGGLAAVLGACGLALAIRRPRGAR